MASSGPALAWGAAGHRMIGEVAGENLPTDVPAFLRKPGAIADLGEYSREPDRWKNAGRLHDFERDPAHYINIRDDGTTLAGQALDTMPGSRGEFDATLRAAGIEPHRSGYLYYAVIDAWQQVVKDFAYVRALTVAIRTETNPARKAWLRDDLARREALTLRDIGVLSHYVGDVSQPLHISVHHNGWGDFPNPEGFTTERIHGPLEGTFVVESVSKEAVRAGVTAYKPCRDGIARCVAARMVRSHAQVIPLYQLEKAGGFVGGDPRGKAFMVARVAEGVTDLRDMIVDAWAESANSEIGWPALKVRDIEAGNPLKTPLYDSLYGED
ncbi:MAG: S1/P1 nuclease [Asticcacaulis sp.]